MSTLVEFLAVLGVVLFFAWLALVITSVLVYAYAWHQGLKHGWKSGEVHHYVDGYNAALSEVIKRCAIEEADVMRLKRS
jgi:hypothetical protein